MQGNPTLVPNGPLRGLSNQSLPRVLELDIDPPIEWDSRAYNSLHLEEPTARMVLAAENELADRMSSWTIRKYEIALVSQAAGVPRQVIERLRISQLREAADFLASFIASGPKTGET